MTISSELTRHVVPQEAFDVVDTGVAISFVSQLLESFTTRFFIDQSPDGTCADFRWCWLKYQGPREMIWDSKRSVKFTAPKAKHGFCVTAC